MTAIDPFFADLLKRQRAPLNALFYQARHYANQLSPEVFYGFLAETLQALVLAAALFLSEAELDEMALELAVLALDLMGKHLLETMGPFQLIEPAWRNLYTLYPTFLAESPRRALAAIANALVQLCLHPRADATRWLAELQTLGAHCQNLRDFLRLGQVLSWRVGMAHNRDGALALIGELPPSIQAEILLGANLRDWQASPWFSPDLSPPRSLRIAHITGHFAAWGGQLWEPPTLAWEEDVLIVSDGLASWYLYADAYGESWFRRGPAQRLCPDLGKWQINADGQVHFGSKSAHFAELAGYRQAAGNQHSLAVALPSSFQIFILCA